MIYPRSGMAYGTDGRLIYTVGGEYLDSEMVGVFRNFEAYDPARDRWYSLPPMTVPRHGFAGGDHRQPVPRRERPAPERNGRRRSWFDGSARSVRVRTGGGRDREQIVPQIVIDVGAGL